MNGVLLRSVVIGFVAAILIHNVGTLGRVPAFPNDDDGAYAAAAYQFWETGKPGVAAYRDVAGLGRDVWAFGRIGAAVQGVFLHFVGVSIFAALLPSFLVGLGLLVVTGALGRALWDTQTGVLAVVLLVASGKFFEACRWARPDMLLTFCFVLSLWLVASASAGRPYRSLFLSGLVMGLAGDVHLNGFLIAPVPLLFWLLLRPESNGVRWRAGLAYAGAGLVGVLYWLAIHYWPDTEGVRQQAALYGGQTHGLRISKLGVTGALKAEVERYLNWFWHARGHRHLFEGLCVFGSGLWMLARAERVGRAIVCIWLACFGIAAVAMSNPYGWYLVYVWPLFMLWMSRAFLAFPVRWLSVTVLGLLLAGYVANLAVWHLKARQDISLQNRLVELRREIPTNAPVVANGMFWFAFWDRDYTDSQYMQFRELESKLRPDLGPVCWLTEQRKRGWRYIVAYGDLRGLLDPKVALEEFLSYPCNRNRNSEIQKARSFSLQHCSVERRIPGLVEPILILRIKQEITHVVQ